MNHQNYEDDSRHATVRLRSYDLRELQTRRPVCVVTVYWVLGSSDDMDAGSSRASLRIPRLESNSIRSVEGTRLEIHKRKTVSCLRKAVKKPIVIAEAIPDYGLFTLWSVVERLKLLHPDDMERYLIARARSFLDRKKEQDRVGFRKVKSKTYFRIKMMRHENDNLLTVASTL